KSRTVKIPKQILCSNSQRIIISFLSGLLATDGYVGVTRQGYPIIEFSTSSKFLAIDLSELLKKIKIEPKINISNYPGSYT
ncbi:MAG: LAGLIDADG family homing endonuclease, partial [Candidatus Aenigmatarchaeota archaeon]